MRMATASLNCVTPPGVTRAAAQG